MLAKSPIGSTTAQRTFPAQLDSSSGGYRPWKILVQPFPAAQFPETDISEILINQFPSFEQLVSGALGAGPKA